MEDGDSGHYPTGLECRRIIQQQGFDTNKVLKFSTRFNDWYYRKVWIVGVTRVSDDDNVLAALGATEGAPERIAA